MADKKTKMKKTEPEPVTDFELQDIMKKVTFLIQKIVNAQEELKDYYGELKEKDVNVGILKNVCKIQESEDYDTFSEYWTLFENSMKKNVRNEKNDNDEDDRRDLEKVD